MSGRVSPVEEKALRLIEQGHVTRLDRTTFAVEGDTGRYLVAAVPLPVAAEYGIPPFVCSCPSRFVCSHAVAAHAVVLGERHQAEPGATDRPACAYCGDRFNPPTAAAGTRESALRHGWSERDQGLMCTDCAWMLSGPNVPGVAA